MSADVGKKLIDISIELLDTLYVHLPLKRSMYAVNPIQRLRLLARRLSAAPRGLSERQFYNEMLSIFSQMRDLHTSFVLPEPFRSATAYLPFRLETCRENGRRQYVVSELMADAPRFAGFERGADVTHWNGVAIERAVAANAEREAGSNDAARHAQGLASMTIRWLGQSLPPDEDWVDVRYRPPKPSSAPRVARFKWHVFIQKSGPEHEVARASGKSLHLGMDARGEVERQVRSFLFGKKRRIGPASRYFGTADDLQTRMPKVFASARNVQTRHGRYGYIRIATFNVANDDDFLDEFIRLVGQLSQDGLILDVRSNGGGLIHAGERLLQLLTPRPIEPCRFHFLNSTRTEQISRRRAFFEWNGSIAQAVETGAEYSQGLSLLPAASYNDIGQKYQGPVVLVTDALCYSTTDIVAAGFQDNGIGRILGIDDNTGAGGANVWEYSLIADLLRRGGRFPSELPGNASFRFAVRRVTRIGKHTGLPLEDLGVVPNDVHEFTRKDVLHRNADLIEHAAKMLKSMPRQRLSATVGDGDSVRVDTTNIDRIDAYLKDRPLSSHRVNNQSVTVQVPRSARFQRELRLQGFRKGQLVAATRVIIPRASA
jgi:hypothetical protein